MGHTAPSRSGFRGYILPVTVADAGYGSILIDAFS
jgi:hypothetical protein